ncbi:hypothetical protein POM88_009162 [Heracleum sosnowskyi]|uniref:Uncharacterized protein n=1 Tax=Heracleum sosnowskyi TaxID=360622 RepID=A0AAD8J9G6_9APIA|nr:hypothetical protein POM88_009162 [Heracleum sosnowskyi]
MDSSSPVSAWIFEDNDWLEDAFEDGTSFGSLNGGAVHNSPTFSFDELRDPWDSLIYYVNASVESSPQNMECVDSASTLSPKLHVLDYEGENSGLKRKVNDDAADSYNPMPKRLRSSVVENGDNTHSTDYMYGQEKQNHFASPVSNGESLRQQFPYFETDSDAAAFATFTESWEFEEVGPFCFEAESLVKFDDTSLICSDIDVGDSFTLCQIPIQSTYKSISELTFPELQVEEKESVANSADFGSPGDANNYEFLGCDVHSVAMDHIPCHDMENLGPSTDGNLGGSSASFTNLSESEGLPSTDIDGDDTSNIHILELLSEPVADSPEHHIACPREAHLSALCNGVIRCVVNMKDTEIPCNANSLIMPSSGKPYQFRGIKAYYLWNEKLNLSETVQSKKALYKAENIKETLDSSETIQSNTALYRADNIKDTPDSFETIISDILSELGINLPFIKRRD